MIMNLISRVDSLFCETKLVTTTTITKRYFNPEEFDAVIKDAEERGLQWRWIFQAEPSIDDQTEQTVLARQEESFVVDGRKIKIPRVVLQRKPIIREDNVPDYSTFPDFADGRKFLTACVNVIKDTSNLLSDLLMYDGIALSRNTRNAATINRKGAQLAFKDREEQSDNDPEVITEEVVWADVKLSLSRHPTWTFLVINFDKIGIKLLVEQPETNPTRYNSDRECVLSAYAFARAALLTYAAAGAFITDIDIEEELAEQLLAMFLAYRTEVDDQQKG